MQFMIMQKFKNLIQVLISKSKLMKPKRKKDKQRRKIIMQFLEYQRMHQKMRSRNHTKN